MFSHNTVCHYQNTETCIYESVQLTVLLFLLSSRLIARFNTVDELYVPCTCKNQSI